MIDIERKIRERAYQSPSRARAAVSRSGWGKKEQARLSALIDAWENEGVIDHVVAGEPSAAEAHVAEVVDVEAEPANGTSAKNGQLPGLTLMPPLRLNLNALIRVRLTTAGVAALYAARDKVVVPADIVQSGGVWHTELWQFMAVFGPTMLMGAPDVPTVDNVIEVLDTRVRA